VKTTSEDQSRIEAFRKRLQGPPREKINWPYWIGSPTAWLALLVSSATAFYALIYRSDELSVVTSPSSIFLAKNGDIQVKAPSSITFINTGSRPIAVLQIQMMFVQPTEKVAEPDCHGRGAFMYFSIAFEQTVIKPYDSVAKAIRFSETESSAEPKKVPLSDENKRLGRDQIVKVCAEFQIIAANAAIWHKIVELDRVTLTGIAVTATDPVRSRKPVFLIKRNWLWTDIGDDQPEDRK
jgi:hypothetical protein